MTRRGAHRSHADDDGGGSARTCALFYADFMKEGDDAPYRIFPSNQSEDGFGGEVRDFGDRTQVMQHARYCLRAAIRAGEALGDDGDLRALWRDRLEHAAPDSGPFADDLAGTVSPPVDPAAPEGLERVCYEANPPEFRVGSRYRPQPQQYDETQPPDAPPQPRLVLLVLRQAALGDDGRSAHG